MAIEWKEEYSVQVKEIDDQHKKLVSIIDELFVAINEEKGKEKLGDILDALIEYGVYHFATEEKYFDEFHYELTEEHKKMHRGFETQITELKKKIVNNEVEVSFELIDYLEDWLLDHLMNVDQKYVKCFKEHGLK
jgi:hemerythrin